MVIAGRAASERALKSAVASERLARCGSLLRCFAAARASQAVAGEIDAVCVVDESIEDGVGVSRITDQLVPFIHGDLAGDDRGAPPVSLLEDLEEIMASGGVERFEAPIVKDQ